MSNYGLTPKVFHYGGLIDAYAKTGTPKYIEEAIKIVKEVPIARDEQAIHNIFSQCVPSQFSSKEDLEKVDSIIPILKQFAIYLDNEGFEYAVLKKTYWRLEKYGMRWPKNVSKK